MDQTHPRAGGGRGDSKPSCWCRLDQPCHVDDSIRAIYCEHEVVSDGPGRRRDSRNREAITRGMRRRQ